MTFHFEVLWRHIKQKGNVMSLKKPENMLYEEAMEELQTIVSMLENGNLSLNDSLKQFERGIHLSRSSHEKLQNAEQQVNILLQKSSGAPLQEFNQ